MGRTKEEIIAELNALTGGDPETDHGTADDLLCEYLEVSGSPEVAAAFRAAQERVGFWYA